MPLCRRHTAAPVRSATLGGVLFGVVLLFGLASPPMSPTTYTISVPRRHNRAPRGRLNTEAGRTAPPASAADGRGPPTAEPGADRDGDGDGDGKVKVRTLPSRSWLSDLPNLVDPRSRETQLPPPGIIAYLVPFTGTAADDVPFGLSDNLDKSLASLEKWYLVNFSAEVNVYHGHGEPGPTKLCRARLLRLRDSKGRPTATESQRPWLRIVELPESVWRLPPGLAAKDEPTWTGYRRTAGHGYSMLYRHRNRFNAIVTWPYHRQLGYRYVWRMEPDSYLHSAVGYDVFTRMGTEVETEAGTGGDGHGTPVFAYRRRYGSAPNAAMARLREAYDKSSPPSIFPARTTSSSGRGGRGGATTPRVVDAVFDTSFSVGDTAFFGSSETAAILEHIDRSGVVYTQLVGDDLVTSQVLARSALAPSQLLRLDSVSYEHVVVVGPGRPGSGCIQSGGITRGTTQRQGTQASFGLSEWNLLHHRFRMRFGACDRPAVELTPCYLGVARHTSQVAFAEVEDQTCNATHPAFFNPNRFPIAPATDDERSGKCVGKYDAAASELRASAGVVVYLAQFSKQHSTYAGRDLDNIQRLNRSLGLLYEHYLNAHPADVIIYYGHGEPGPSPAEEKALMAGRIGLRVLPLPPCMWTLPAPRWITAMKWRSRAFSAGYRHMCRLFGIKMWKYHRWLGYQYVWRMDDDSFIHSKIGFDVFARMASEDFKYVYRQLAGDRPSDWFSEMWDQYLVDRKILPKQEIYGIASKSAGFYTNFFVGSVEFFTSPEVDRILAHVDHSQVIYTHRQGDLGIQTAVVKTFLRPAEIFKLVEVTYEHTTTISNNTKRPNGGCLQNGGVSRGTTMTDTAWRRHESKYKAAFSHCKDPALIVSDCFLGSRDVGQFEANSTCRYTGGGE